MQKKKFLGVVVTPANIQTEGMRTVFDILQDIQTDAVAIDPWLLQPAAPNQGSRIPDLHIDGHKRLFSRPLWGKRELSVDSFLAFQPQEKHYSKTPYRPHWKPIPADLDPELPQKMIDEAKARNIKVHLGIGPLMPPNPRPQDRPRIVTGDFFKPPLIANNICLNSPAGLDFALAFIQDLLENYAGVDGLILDWVEFGAYKLEDHFSCFCEHCEHKAGAFGFDWSRMKRDMLALWEKLHYLSERDLEQSQRLASSSPEFLEGLSAFPGCFEFLRFKSDSVVAFYRKVRLDMDQMGYPDISLTARGWIAPWNRSSGMDYRRLSEICSVVAPKIFTFDHAVIPRWLGETIISWNPNLPEDIVLDAVLTWLNLPDNHKNRRLADYQIPGPDEPHPAKLSAYADRVEAIVDQVGGRAPCFPIAHPYLPLDQWRTMLEMLSQSRADGIWVNFYSYLSDQHLEVLHEIWAGEKVA